MTTVWVIFLTPEDSMRDFFDSRAGENPLKSAGDLLTREESEVIFLALIRAQEFVFFS